MVVVDRLAVVLVLDIRALDSLQVSRHPRRSWLAGTDDLLLYCWVRSVRLLKGHLMLIRLDFRHRLFGLQVSTLPSSLLSTQFSRRPYGSQCASS
jgi:hypothetical protein